MNNYDPLDLILGKETDENKKNFGSPSLELGWVKNVSNDFGTDRVVDVVTADDSIVSHYLG